MQAFVLFSQTSRMIKVNCFVVFIFIVFTSFTSSLNVPSRLSEIDDENNEKPQQEPEHKIVVVGDMLLTESQYQFLYTNDSFKRHGLKRVFNHWPGAIVPVAFAPNTFSEEFITVVKSAMEYISRVSCVKFEFNRRHVDNYILITKGSGCSSQVGNLRQGEQYLRLNQNVCERGNIIHELLHGLGFLHMHTAEERDKFIKINLSNVNPQGLKNFEKYTAFVTMYNTQYDYHSIMHYSRNAFAIDKNKPTIVPFERVSNMGQRHGMKL